MVPLVKFGSLLILALRSRAAASVIVPNLSAATSSVFDVSELASFLLHNRRGGEILSFASNQCNTTLSISISVTNLCVSSMCIASSFSLSFAFKSRSN
jgi:hypothetical protein